MQSLFLVVGPLCSSIILLCPLMTGMKIWNSLTLGQKSSLAAFLIDYRDHLHGCSEAVPGPLSTNSFGSLYELGSHNHFTIYLSDGIQIPLFTFSPTKLMHSLILRLTTSLFTARPHATRRGRPIISDSIEQ